VTFFAEIRNVGNWPGGVILEPWQWSAPVGLDEHRRTLEDVIDDVERGLWGLGHDPGMPIVTADGFATDDVSGERYRFVVGRLAPAPA
jgi:hypothetical protein